MQDFDAADAPALAALTTAVGWPHTVDDWRGFLAVGEVFGHREVLDGSAAAGSADLSRPIVSSCALFRFGGEVTSIGLVVVRDTHRGRGLARETMQRCLDTARAPVVTLIATAFGLPVYLHMGFVTVAHVLRMVGEPCWPGSVSEDEAAGMGRRAGAAPARIEPYRGTVLPQLIDLDALASGCERGAMLESMIVRSPCVRVALGAEGEPLGFAVANVKLGLTYVGPVVAPSTSVALALIRAVAASVPGKLRVDVPATQSETLGALEAVGFAMASRDPVMTLKGVALPGERELVHSISYQAFG
jgi:GNAT superfamily N-acetyltransferase